ncbi:hypothetical protein J6590_062440 [Homalodisca vitripennis]|nr:hypothetical protein J6590_062440 [Homalodisca vitripennis]
MASNQAYYKEYSVYREINTSTKLRDKNESIEEFFNKNLASKITSNQNQPGKTRQDPTIKLSTNATTGRIRQTPSKKLHNQSQTPTEELSNTTEYDNYDNQIENTVITGYYLKAHFCRTEHRKGGVAIYVDKNLVRHTEELIVVQFCREITLEAALIKIRLKQSVIHILGTYRSPNGDFDLALETVSNIITSTRIDYYPLVIMGHINVDILNPDRRSTLLDETLASHNSKRVQLPATRITPTTQSSIDWICSNIDTEKLDTKVIHAGISDHTAQSCENESLPQKKKSSRAQMHTWGRELVKHSAN